MYLCALSGETRNKPTETTEGHGGKREILNKIKYVVGLGNAESCDLSLSNYRYNSGKFTLLGICEEGGKRLINPGRITQLMKLSPNPSDGIVNIELNLVEKGMTSFRLYNIEGLLL